MSKLLLLGKLYPQNFASYLLGVLVRVKIPFLSPILNRLFIVAFGINMNEAEYPTGDYETIEDIFTRRLKVGERPISGSLVSPADGTWSQGGPIVGDRAIQAKGLDYDAKELVFGKAKPASSSEAKLARFETIYLAPHNYHRVHSPVSGRLKTLRYIPGELWPVNEPFVRWLPQLFTRNERLVFDIELEQGGWVYAVMVGALNVGRISSPFLPEFFSNDYPSGRKAQTFQLKDNISLMAGDELGTFMLGSTVVLVFDEKAATQFKFTDLAGKRAIRMGESLMPQ